MGNVLHGKLERINGCIFHRVGRDEFIRKGGLDLTRSLCIQNLYRDIALGAQTGKIGRVFLVITFYGHKHAAGVFNTVWGELFEKLGFLAAFFGTPRIGKNIAAAAMQKAVIGPGCAGVDIILLSQDAVYPAQSEVTGQAGAGGTAADDQYLGLECGHSESPLNKARPYINSF